MRLCEPGPMTLSPLGWPAARLALILALVAPGAQAARPYVTDDARITPSDGCQVETWVHSHRRHRGGNEFWAVPACNPTGNLEITAGVNRLTGSGDEPSTANALLQLKTLLRTLDTGIGTGFAVGMTARTGGPGTGAGAPSWLSGTYAYNVTSFSFRDESFVLLTLAGLKRDRERGRTLAMWGVGSETLLLRRGPQELILAAEVFGAEQGRPGWQAGFRFWVVKEKVQVDAVMGAQIANSGPDGRWVSIGLRLIGDGFLR